MKIERGRVAVVTGGASGIGLALAKAAAESGMKVLISDVQAEALDKAVADLTDAGGSVNGLVADVSKPDDIAGLVEAAFELGSVQLVCSNAGIVVPGLAWTISESDWERVIDINLMATIRLVHAFFPRLIEAGDPAYLLVTGSMASVTARPGISPYVTAKHGLLGFCEVLSHELTASNAPIGVSLLMPGRVVTGMNNVPTPGEISSEECARIAFEGVAGDQLFIFPQPDRIPEVVARFADIVAMRTPAAPA